MNDERLFHHATPQNIFSLKLRLVWYTEKRSLFISPSPSYLQPSAIQGQNAPDNYSRAS